MPQSLTESLVPVAGELEKKWLEMNTTIACQYLNLCKMKFPSQFKWVKHGLIFIKLFIKILVIIFLMQNV